MEAFLFTLKKFIYFALQNYQRLPTREKFEVLKFIGGFLAGWATAPQTEGLSDLESKIFDNTTGKLPTNPTNLATGHFNWLLDSGAAIDAAMRGEPGAADRAVDTVHHIGDYMVHRRGD